MSSLTIAWMVAFFFFATTGYLAVRLQHACCELDRVRRRMGRLDELADDVASRETTETFRETRMSVGEEEGAQPAGASVVPVLRDSGEFTPIMQFDSDAESGDVDFVLEEADIVVEEDDQDFAAPRMALTERSGQIAARLEHETPVGSPRTMMPHQQHSLVSVGSISVRSENDEPFDRLDDSAE